MKTSFCITLGLLAALSAHAAPVQLSEAAFAGALAPLDSTVEDFEGFSDRLQVVAAATGQRGL